MSDTGVRVQAARGPGFAIWGLVCSLATIIGFWPSYVSPIMAGTYTDIVPLMPLHALSAGLWIILIFSQPTLVLKGQMNLHRLFGIAGALVALSTVITGTIVQLQVMSIYAAQGDTAKAAVLPFFRLVTLAIFAVCIAAAVALRERRPDWHSRLMFLGTFSLLEAAFDRFFANILQLPGVSGPMAAVVHSVLMISFLIWDRRTHGRVHPASLWGAIVVTLIIFGTAPIAFSDWWEGLAAQLAGG